MEDTPIISLVNADYLLNSCINKSQEKDLGDIIDNELKFHKYTSAAVNKAKKILAVVNKSFENIDCPTRVCNSPSAFQIIND